MPVAAEVAESALCDAQHIGRVDDGCCGQPAPDELTREAGPGDTHVGPDIGALTESGDTHVGPGTGQQQPVAVLPVRAPAQLVHRPAGWGEGNFHALVPSSANMEIQMAFKTNLKVIDTRH